jgi:hypothetical protein
MTRPTKPVDRAAGDSVDLTGRVYHTENGNVHAEGETYPVTDRALAETLRAIGFVSIEGWSELPPPVAPVVASLTPDTAALGAAPFTLQVIGTGFTATDVVHCNSAPAATTFVSATELTTPVDLTTVPEGAIPVSVQTAGGLGSNAVVFTVTAAARRDDGGLHQGQIDPPHRHTDPPTHRGR